MPRSLFVLADLFLIEFRTGESCTLDIRGLAWNLNAIKYDLMVALGTLRLNKLCESIGTSKVLAESSKNTLIEKAFALGLH